MLSDFFPGIVSVGILVGVFLVAWISDVRRIQRFNTLEQARTGLPSETESDTVEPLSISPDLG